MNSEEDAAMKAKLAKQRNEIARLTELVRRLSEDKRKMLLDLNQLRKLTGASNG